MWASLRRFTASGMPLVGLILLLVVLAMALSANLIFPQDPLALAGAPLTPPFEEAGLILGTDSVGRDIAAQLFYGARVSLLVGVAATSIAITIGIIVGALSGYFGGTADAVLMRVTEAFQTVPSFILLLVLVVIFGSKLMTLILAIGAISWIAPARLTRAEFLSLRSRDFVLSCRTIGMSHIRIIFREILPSALPPVIAYVSVVMALAILLESALAFLGLSDPNIASWGNMIGDGRRVLRTAWYVAAMPGFAILLTVLAISLVGQGLNDLLNPRLGKR